MSKKKNNKVVAEAGEGKDENNVHKEEKEQKQGGEGAGGGGDDGGKKGGQGNALLYKLDLHCEGCASKVLKIVKGFEGVETVKIDGASGKCAVTGKVDAVKLRDKLEQKTHKKVDLLTPVPKKEKENTKSKDESEENTKSKDESGDGKENKKKEKDNKSKDKNSDDNKKNRKDENTAKQLPVTSAMLKVPLHCEGCIQKIHKIVSKTKGFEEMKLDKQSEVVMVKGAMDMKALVETLKKHLKRDVEIMQPKKDEKKEKEKEKDKKEKKGKGGAEGNAAADGGGEGVPQDGRETMEENKMQVQHFNYGYGYPMYAPSYVGGPGDPYYQFNYHAPQMFSDENPNACSIM